MRFHQGPCRITHVYILFFMAILLDVMHLSEKQLFLQHFVAVIFNFYGYNQRPFFLSFAKMTRGRRIFAVMHLIEMLL